MKPLRESTAWIYVVAVVALLPPLFLRDFTPDNELRYLSIADEALRNGSLFCFSNHGDIYADKPPLYLWIVMLGRMLCGQNCMWFIGLFSLVPMLLCGAVMDSWSKPFLTVRQRQSALLMLFTCGFFPGLALTLRMDMLMTLWILLALRAAFNMVLRGSSRSRQALLGLFTFLALFTKGPLGVLIPLLGSVAWLAWTRRIKLFPRIWGWPAWSVMLAGCAVWFSGVYAEGGPDYLNNLLFHQTVHRSVNAFTHARPWWYYALHIWYIMAPWSLLILWLACRRPRQTVVGDFRRLLLAVFVVTFVMLSSISSKLQVYILPAIPFVVWLGASLIENRRLSRVVNVISLCILSLVFVASWFIPRVNPLIGYGSVCREIASRNPSMVFVDSGVRRGENIDAYFNCPVSIVTDGFDLGSAPSGSYLIKSEAGSLYYECNR